MATKTSPFMRKKLALAVSAVLIGGTLSGCITDDDNNSNSGVSSINMAGGQSGAAGYAGHGGALLMEVMGGSEGVTISRKGRADASFKPVSEDDVEGVMSGLGSNPLVVEADTTIEGVQVVGNVGFTAYSEYLDENGVLYYDTNGTAFDEPVTDGRLYTDAAMTELREADGYGSLAAAGTPYYGDGGEFMMNGVKVADGDDSVNDPSATGLSVAEGATLTIDNSYYYYSGVAFDGDVINKGTITWGSRNNPGFILSDGVIANAGVIDMSGVNPGDSGGSIGLYAYAIANSGTITAAGAEGGDGGEVGLYSYIGVVNRGPIDVSGGDAPEGAVPSVGNGLVMTGYAGDGGEIGVFGKHIENTAMLDLSGGDGQYAGGGGDLRFDAEDVVNNSGDIDAGAGIGEELGYMGWVDMSAENESVNNSGDINAGGGDGAEFGGVRMTSKYGSVVSNGDIDVSGGVSLSGENGGDGGEIVFEVITPYGHNGSVEVSGNLDVSGGDGTLYAGDGGSIGLVKGFNASEGGVALLGYTDINGDGGDGMFLGNGGRVMAMSTSGHDIRFGLNANSFGPDMPGPIVNSADISLRGGDAHVDIDSSEYASYGGGGVVVMGTSMYSGGMEPRLAVAADTGATVSNSGDIDVSGGTVVNSYSSYVAHGGMVNLSGATGVSNSGKLLANGGDDIGDSESASYGGFGGEVGIYTGSEGEYTAKNSGTIQVNGGDGNYFGGHGGTAGVGGWGSVNNSGNIYADGGNASMEIAFSYGGDGGEIEVVHVLETGSFNNTGTLSANAGSGMTLGNDGVIDEGLDTVEE